MQFWDKQDFLVGLLEAPRVDECCPMRTRGCPGTLIRLVLIQWSYEAMDLSDWPHVEMVRRRCVFLRKDVNCGRC